MPGPPLDQNAALERPFSAAVLRLLRGIPGYPNLRMIELGCGDAWLLQILRADGGRAIRGTTFLDLGQDYIRERTYPEGLDVDTGIDLNRPLPYADAEFDVVYTSEVIEHVDSHLTMVGEACRVLRPGGTLVLSTPNLHRLSSRLHFALTGLHLTCQAMMPYDLPIERIGEYHHRPVDFPLMHYLLWQHGLRIQHLEPSRVKRIDRVAAWVLPVLRTITRHAMDRLMPVTGYATAEGRRDLERWMSDRVLAVSEQICLAARKT